MIFDGNSTLSLEQTRIQITEQIKAEFNSSVSESSVDFIYFLKDFNGYEYCLKVERLPISVESSHQDGWIAYYKPVNLYGFGDTFPEAIKDLQNDFIDLLKELKDTPDNKLGKLPRKWKQHLSEIIMEK